MTPTQLTPASAVLAARSTDLDTMIGAREFAERRGYDAFETREPMPFQFSGVVILHEGFSEGLANARCEHELIRAGLL